MSDSEQKLTLGELPVEVILDDILPFVPAHDLLRLGSTNKNFSVLCNDDTLWKHKLDNDFNFTGEGTARTSGYKFLYRGLDKPRVFVWGEKSNGRLGLDNPPKSMVNGVPYPVQIPLHGVRVVSLVAGGMSFHALDSKGNIHVWGTLNGSLGPGGASNRGFSVPEKVAKSPHRLILPSPVRAISCGRLHSSCLDRADKVWTFTNWGRPFYLATPILLDPDYAPKQVECGWAFSALLTKSGAVFIWWPYTRAMNEVIERKMREMDEEGDHRADAQNGVISCSPWAMHEVAPTLLPALPTLPDLEETGTQKHDETKLIQIAAFDNHLVGLTNQGHVLKYGSLFSEDDISQGRWEYLPKFSDLRSVKELSAFTAVEGNRPLVRAPGSMKITHISANFRHFVAYSTGSSSIVLLGDTEVTPDKKPQVIPELQNKSVISVVIGDYHSAALTAQGKLLTWGKYSNGALGLGDPAKLAPGSPGGFPDEQSLQLALERRRGEPPSVDIPTEVRFDHNLKKPRERFCFAVTAAGWHTGALVVDLEPGEDEPDEITSEEPPRVNLPRAGGIIGRGPFLPQPHIFRFGHAAGQGHSPSGGGAAS